MFCDDIQIHKYIANFWIEPPVHSKDIVCFAMSFSLKASLSATPDKPGAPENFRLYEQRLRRLYC